MFRVLKDGFSWLHTNKSATSVVNCSDRAAHCAETVGKFAISCWTGEFKTMWKNEVMDQANKFNQNLADGIQR